MRRSRRRRRRKKKKKKKKKRTFLWPETEDYSSAIQVPCG
jgi:hypothetical protein